MSVTNLKTAGLAGQWGGTKTSTVNNRPSVSATTGSPTQGTAGNLTTYTWTASGSITLSRGGLVSWTIVAGGGGGGNTTCAGGGGAGGMFEAQNIYIAAGTWTVTVGAGGALGVNGNPSVVYSGNVGFSSPGGGAGNATQYVTGSSGGSGGGGSPAFGGTATAGAEALVATVTPVEQEVAILGQIREVVEEAGLVRLAARRSAAPPPLPVRAEMAVRQSSTGRHTQAAVVAAVVNLQMRQVAEREVRVGVERAPDQARQVLLERQIQAEAGEVLGRPQAAALKQVDLPVVPAL